MQKNNGIETLEAGKNVTTAHIVHPESTGSLLSKGQSQNKFSQR